MTITRFAFPTAIHFGAGARKLVAAHLLDQGLKRPLIVTDRALAALPVMAEFKIAPGGAGRGGVRRRVRQPDLRAGDGRRRGVQGARRRLRDRLRRRRGARRAKVVGVMAVHDGDVLEYVWDHPQVRPIVNALPYMVALPTTSGTGSEVGRSSVVSENDTHHKRTVFSPKILAARGLRRPRADAGAAGRGDRRHRHGRADAQHRELPVAGLPPAVRRHRARGLCASARVRWPPPSTSPATCRPAPT